MRHAALALTLALAACATPATPDAPRIAAAAPAVTLDGAPWRIEEAQGRPFPDRARTTIEFRGNRAAGVAACNRFMGSVTQQGASLRFGPLAGTRMACPDALMEAERRIHAALAATRSWRAEADDSVALLDESGQRVARLRR